MTMNKQHKGNSIVKVTAGIMTQNRKIFIAQRAKPASLNKLWEFPGGKVEQGETPETSLMRELVEEFSIYVSVHEFVGSSVYHYPDISIELLAYKVLWLDGRIQLKEHLSYSWALVDELDQYRFAPADIPIVKKIRMGEIEV